ncbi:NIPSNAP family protein [Microvirga antarctica]|uniref:NIPSNAP family protein n=1 Tax=Microvirga antarctica TaxID=2819233 RepID=UPI001B309213
MIVEKRTYTMHSGMMKDYLKAYTDGSFQNLQQQLGHCVGFFTSETGPIEQVTQLWAYKDWNDREARRAALYSDPAFIDRAKDMYGLIKDKDSQILKPVAFAPLSFVRTP